MAGQDSSADDRPLLVCYSSWRLGLPCSNWHRCRVHLWRCDYRICSSNIWPRNWARRHPCHRQPLREPVTFHAISVRASSGCDSRRNHHLMMHRIVCDKLERDWKIILWVCVVSGWSCKSVEWIIIVDFFLIYSFAITLKLILFLFSVELIGEEWMSFE